MAVSASKAKVPVDIEEALGLYHGNIFQDAPTFPFAETKEQAGTWGVETEWENVFLLRFDRATRRRGQRHPRAQRREESVGNDQPTKHCRMMAAIPALGQK